MLERYTLSALPRERALHHFLEASRFAFADRGTYLGDPEFVKVPTEGAAVEGVRRARRELIGERAGCPPVAAGTPPARRSRPPP